VGPIVTPLALWLVAAVAAAAKDHYECLAVVALVVAG